MQGTKEALGVPEPGSVNGKLWNLTSCSRGIVVTVFQMKFDDKCVYAELFFYV